MNNFKNLLVWQKAIELIVEIYSKTSDFPKFEVFGLNSQLQRAAVSISCNISEGCGKSSKKDFKRFLEIALGSANEVENLLIISEKLEYISKSEFESLDERITEINKMLVGLIRTLQ